ncbi:MAG: ABC transporter permease [Deltaproteobacteria bacterium]|nr:ABC transporter permease [Deltaproteobacteria bacterium]
MPQLELSPRRYNLFLWIQAVGGVVLLVAGILFTIATFREAAEHVALPGEPEYEIGRISYLAMFGPILVGLIVSIRAFVLLAGYQGFVALRYLLIAHPKVTLRTKLAIAIGVGLRYTMYVLVDPKVSLFAVFSGRASDPGMAALLILRTLLDLFLVVVIVWGVLRHSKPALIVFFIGLVLAIACVIASVLIDAQGNQVVAYVITITLVVGALLAGLAIFFGVLRAFFTFFTTVPIGGVWIGTSALVMVLAVMSGFETDLRQKILGSNAHIQVSKDDGTEFTEWPAVKAKIDKIPGVVASTPYAVSEVVLAANNNGMPVIIKGIDPATVGAVTDLVADLEDRNAINELDPKVLEKHDRTVKQGARPSDEELPPDMPTGGDPIDFSGGGGSSGGPDDKAPDDTHRPDTEEPIKRITPGDKHDGDKHDGDKHDDDYGGDARVIQPDLYDEIPPTELLQWATGTDLLPEDLELGRPSDRGGIVRITDEPSLARRTAALPGILVGRELVKQTHLYTGQEVRVVSPLSDPSNPDATGTPIPFNRDYRVAGIFFTGMYEYDLKYVYVTLDSLQVFLDRGDAVDGIEVRIKDADDTGRYVPDSSDPHLYPGLIREALGPGYRVQDWRELNRSLFSALKLEKIAMFLVLGIVILVASFSIVGNLIMVVVEKAREIALLKTLGASDFGVMKMFALQGLMIGVIGTALGVATGLIGCWAGKNFGLPLNPDVYYIDKLPIHVDPSSVGAAAAAGILISIAATLYPAFLAARVRPAAGMRH